MGPFDVLPRVKNLKYKYDYGDGWEIDISLLNKGEKFLGRLVHPEMHVGF